MIEVNVHYSAEDFAQANWEAKKKFRILSAVIISLASIFCILAFVMIMLNDDYTYWSAIFGLSIFIIVFLSSLLINLSPIRFAKRLIKTNQALANGIDYKYIFGDEEFEVIEKTSNAESTNKLKYSALKKVVFDSNYIFLYINKLQSFPVKNEAVNDENMNELKTLLSSKVLVIK